MYSSTPSSQLTKIKPLLKKSSGVIFDFDGLLADSEPYHYLAYNEVFQRYGHSLDKDEYWVEWTSKGKALVIYWSWNAEDNWVRFDRFGQILR